MQIVGKDLIMKKVSIIVPVYNLENCLSKCLETLINQTYTNFEVILIDDGSKDGSYEICKDFCKKDNRFRVLHHDNHGVSFSRNKGLESASGEYVIFVDGDDEVLPDMLAHYVTAMEDSQADVTIGGLVFIEENGLQINKIPEKEGIFRQEIWNEFCKDGTGIYGYVPNKMYRLQLLKKENIRFREDMSAQEDLEFALSVYSKSQLFCLISYSGYLYYHVQGKRKMPVNDLIENQIKMLKYAYRAKTSKESIDAVIKKIQEMVYGALFHSDSEADICELTKIENLKIILSHGKGQHGEKKWILKLFLSEKYAVIYQYFRIRNGLKKWLGKVAGNGYVE